MRITQSAQICLSVIKKSQKTGFGPNRLQRKGTHFVGTEPPVLKYHILQDKKPNEEYGLQGTNHELPGTGKVHSKLPTKVHMKKDKVYAWCSCGYSGSQPLCDGSHNSIRIPDLKLKPVRFIPDKDMTVWLCNCKQTNNRLMAGFMIITSFISLWISDTACCALMAPIAYALLEEIMIPKMRPEEKENEIEVMKIFDKEDPEEKEKKKLDTSRLSVRDRGICKCMMLLVAHASLIGGTGTINSTGPNLIFRDNIEKNFPNEDHGISYLSWMAFAIPPMIFYMFSSWFIVQLQFLGPRHLMGMFREPTETEKQEEEVAKRAVWKSYDQLGPMTWAEKSTLVIFVLAVLSWVSSDPKVIPGWSDLFRKGYVTDSCSGLVAVFLLFIWPKKKPDFRIFRKDKSRPSVRQEPLIDWDCVRRRFPWSIILLLGAGFAISDAVRVSGLSSLIACSLNSTISKMPFFVMQIILSIVVVVMTEFSTNSATASIFIPISFKMAEAVGAHPLYFSIPTAIGPSFSFMLPMATPANAIVYETKTIRMIDMVSCGVFLNIFCIAITAINMNTWAFWLFNMGTYPDYALRHATNMTGNSSQCF